MTTPLPRIREPWSAPRCTSRSRVFLAGFSRRFFSEERRPSADASPNRFHQPSLTMSESSEQRSRAHATSRIAPVSPPISEAVARLLAEPGYTDDLRDYLGPLLQNWRPLAIVTILAALAAFVFSQYRLIRWYQAIAIIKPMTPQPTAGHLQGVLGGANL